MELRRSKKRYKNKQKMDKHYMELLRGKIEFLLSEYGLDETCKINKTMIERIMNILRKNGKENAIVEYKIINGGKEKNFILLGIENQIIKIDLKHGTAELSNCTKTCDFSEKPSEYISLEDLEVEKKDDYYLYTLDDFIFDTNINIRSRNKFLNLRPAIVCKDGFTLSVDASRFVACKPKGDNRTDYTHFEVGELFHEISGLDAYRRTIYFNDKVKRNVYEYVPKKMVEDILEEHGGIDVEKTFRPSELDKLCYSNLGLNRGFEYLKDILDKSDRYDALRLECTEIDGEDKEDVL